MCTVSVLLEVTRYISSMLNERQLMWINLCESAYVCVCVCPCMGGEHMHVCKGAHINLHAAVPGKKTSIIPPHFSIASTRSKCCISEPSLRAGLIRAT